MGIDPFLPANITRLIPKEERAKLKVETPEEVGERVAVKLEKELHDQFLTWCTMKGIIVIRARMDKPSTIAKGWPDTTLLWNGRACCIELKAPGKTTTVDQEKQIWRLKENGTPVTVCEYLQDAIKFALVALNLKEVA
jgi:hypothetical protein